MLPSGKKLAGICLDNPVSHIAMNTIENWGTQIRHVFSVKYFSSSCRRIINFGSLQSYVSIKLKPARVWYMIIEKVTSLKHMCSVYQHSTCRKCAITSHNSTHPSSWDTAGFIIWAALIFLQQCIMENNAVDT